MSDRRRAYGCILLAVVAWSSVIVIGVGFELRPNQLTNPAIVLSILWALAIVVGIFRLARRGFFQREVTGPTIPSSAKALAGLRGGLMEYFEVPEARPGQDGICSDNDCPCGYPGANIPRGSGYIYISKTVVDFRQDARTVREAEQKIALMQQRMPVLIDQNVATSTLMCEQGARKRGLDLDIAAADAKYWWETGLVPLRATPLADST